MVDVGPWAAGRGRRDRTRYTARTAISSMRSKGRANRIRCSYGEALKTHRVALAISRSGQTGTAGRGRSYDAKETRMFEPRIIRSLGVEAPGQPCFFEL